MRYNASTGLDWKNDDSRVPKVWAVLTLTFAIERGDMTMYETFYEPNEQDLKDYAQHFSQETS